MRYIIFITTFLLLSISLWAQSPITRTEQIKDINIQMIHADGYFYKEFPIRSSNATAKIIATDWKANTTGTVLNLPKTDAIEIRISYERKVPKLVVKIPAVKLDASIQEYLSGVRISITDPIAPTTAAKPTYPSHSVLASGDWYKIAITQRGIHKIDAAFLNSMGINTSSLNPANIRIYGNGGQVLSEIPDDTAPSDLIENAIYVSASGATFGSSDYVLFYADGLTKWTYTGSEKFKHTPNYFSDIAYYFINIDKGPGKRIPTINETGTAVHTFSTFDDYTVIDNDSFYYSSAGKIWFSNRMLSHATSTLTQNVTLQLTDPVGPATIAYQFGSTVPTGGSNISLKLNSNPLGSLNFLGFANYDEVKILDGSGTATLTDKNLNFQFKFTPSGTGTGVLDYIRVNALSNINFTGKSQMNFRNNSTSSYIDQLVAYQMSNAGSAYTVWDISNPLAPKKVSLSHSGSNSSFKHTATRTNEFIGFNGSSFFTPSLVGKIANQDLHALTPKPLIIITPDSFISIARGIAQMHEDLEGFQSIIVTPAQIYNEFSSGSQDVAAIRNFIRMFYDRAGSPDALPENVLLLGAASYDYKDRVPNNTNFVPIYQSYNSANFGGGVNSSFSTDDYYALLDSAEALRMSVFSKYDIGIGRIPIVTVSQGNKIVSKIKNYLSANSFGPWKNNALFLADDGDISNFANDNDKIVNSIKINNPILNNSKLYADAYEKEPGASGDTYPKVSSELNSQMYQGNILLNYSGHGNPERLSHESILIKSQINSFTNIDRLPVVITATCDFGRYDNPNVESGGAMLFLKPDGGSIASVTTIQQVFPLQSTALISKYIPYQFKKQADGTIHSMGKALMLAKNDYDGSTNDNIKFVLLGDPALKLAIPRLDVQTDSLKTFINATELAISDTLSALGSYILYGSVTNNDGSIRSDFNGTVYVSIYDKPQYNEVLPTSDFYSTYKKFQTQTSIIYRGQVIANNGQFEIKLIIPKDMNYEFGNGKISYYAHDTENDGAGYDESITVGGFAAYQITDNEPPVVTVFIDDEKYRDGGVTGPDPLLFVKLSDDNGINVSGSSVGHDMIAILDGDLANPYVLNNYYFTNPGDITKGTVHFPLSKLSVGMHEIEVRAWDMMNNPGSGKVRFEVKNKDEGFISEAYNYPNPMYQSYTNFVIQHNLKNVKVEVSIQIFDNSGSNVKTISQTLQPDVNRLEINWNARNENGLELPAGLYHYRVVMRTENKSDVTAYNKLVIVR